MAERRGPVVPPGVVRSKRQVSGRKLLLWLVGAAVLVAVAFAVVRFVGFGGSESQPAAPPPTLPPDPDPPAPTSTTTVPTTTTEPADVEIFDSDQSAADEDDSGTTAPQGDQSTTAADAPAAQDATVPASADASFRTIDDAGDFTGRMTLQCVDYSVKLTWHVNPPYELLPDGELETDRVRTPAPIGGQGSLRVEIETWVPAVIDLEAAEELPPDGLVEETPSDETAEDDLAVEPSPDEAAEDDASDETPPAEAIAEDVVEATQLPETVLVLEALSISGRGTDRDGEGEVTGVMRHQCPSASLDESAEWTVTVEGHAEVAWELAFDSEFGDADDSGDDAENLDETDDGVASVGELIDRAVDEVAEGGDDQ